MEWWRYQVSMSKTEGGSMGESELTWKIESINLLNQYNQTMRVIRIDSTSHWMIQQAKWFTAASVSVCCCVCLGLLACWINKSARSNPLNQVIKLTKTHYNSTLSELTLHYIISAGRVQLWWLQMELRVPRMRRVRHFRPRKTNSNKKWSVC